MNDMSEKTRGPWGVLFDLDGVLLDSEGQYSVFWAAMDKEYSTGVPNFADYIKGFHLTRILKYFADEEIRQEVLGKLLAFERQMLFDFFPGALDFVKQLRTAGVPMAIVTSSDKKKMQALFSQYPEFPELFDKVVTGDMVTRAKPDPDCFLMGAKQLGLDIKDCVVLEDSRNGLLAGKASGAKVVGIATTLPAEQVSALCDLMVNSVSELTVDRLIDLM